MMNDTDQELVYDVFVNGEYHRTFVNQIQIDEFSKRVLERDELAEIVIEPDIRSYVEL